MRSKLAAAGAIDDRPRYRAFLSYSHADRVVALDIQRTLHRLGRAWYRRPAFTVFRDETALAASPGLEASLESALENTEYLVLLASTGAADSLWVDREVRWWLTAHGTDRLLLVLLDGEIRWSEELGDFDRTVTTALPPTLFGAFRSVPLWVDLREVSATGGAALRNPVFHDRIANLAATLHGCTKDELVSEELRQQLTWTRVRNTAIALLSLVTALAVIASILFLGQRDEARRQTAEAQAREYAARALETANPYEALALAVEAGTRTEEVLPEARAAYAAAVQRAARQPVRPVSALIDAGARDISWSPLGSRIATASPEGLQFLDAVTGQPTGEAHAAHAGHEVASLAWSPDGIMIASADDDTEVVLFNADTGRPVGTPRGVDAHEPGEPLTTSGSVSWSPDGTRLAAAGSDASVLVWDLQETSVSAAPLRLPSGGVAGVAWSPDGSRIATVNHFSDTIQLWDVVTGAAVAEPLRANGTVTAIDWSPDGSRLAVTGSAGTEIWALGGQSPSTTVTEEWGEDVAWSPDGTLLVTVGYDLRVWDAAAGQQMGEVVYDHEDGTYLNASRMVGVSWSPDGDRLATNSLSGTVRIWALTAAAVPGSPSVARHPDGVTALAWSPDGSRVVSGGPNGVVNTWSVADFSASSRPEASFYVGSRFLEMSADGSLLAVAPGPFSGDEPIRILETASEQQVETLAGHEGADTLAWSPAGHWLASVGDDGSVWLWDVDAGVPIGPALTEPEEREALVTVAWSPDGTQLATADSTAIRVWEFSNGSLSTTHGEGQPHNQIAWAPDGSRIASADDRGRVHLYDVHTGNDLTAPLPPLGLIGDLVWQPGSSLLAVTIPQQGTALLLDGGTGALIASVTHSGTELKALAFAPDGRSMVTGGYDGTIQLWRALLERDACRQAHEGLSPSLLRTLLGPGRPVPRCAEPAQVPDAEPLPVVYTQILAGG